MHSGVVRLKLSFFIFYASYPKFNLWKILVVYQYNKKFAGASGAALLRPKGRFLSLYRSGRMTGMHAEQYQGGWPICVGLCSLPQICYPKSSRDICLCLQPYSISHDSRSSHPEEGKKPISFTYFAQGPCLTFSGHVFWFFLNRF